MKKFMGIVLLAGGLILGEESTALAKQGFYLGLELPYNTIGGDFDGESVLEGPTDFIIVPKIDGAFGWGILVGYGFDVSRYVSGYLAGKTNHQELAFELDFLSSSHNAKWRGESLGLYYLNLDFNLKYSFMTDRSTQPYVLIGMGIPHLIIKDGSGSFTTSKVGDAELAGVGLNLGVGVDYYFTPHFSTGAGLIYHHVKYDMGSGAEAEVEGSAPIESALDGSGFSLILNTVYHF